MQHAQAHLSTLLELRRCTALPRSHGMSRRSQSSRANTVTVWPTNVTQRTSPTYLDYRPPIRINRVVGKVKAVARLTFSLHSKFDCVQQGSLGNRSFRLASYIGGEGNSNSKLFERSDHCAAKVSEEVSSLRATLLKSEQHSRGQTHDRFDRLDRLEVWKMPPTCSLTSYTFQRRAPS